MFAEIKRKPFIPITTAAVLTPPLVTVLISDAKDTSVLAIDLSVKQKEDSVDSVECSQNSGNGSSSVSNRYRNVTLPSTTENTGSSYLSSDVDMENPKQQVVNPDTSGSDLITVLPSDSSSVSDSLLSPRQTTKSTLRINKAKEDCDSVSGSNNTHSELRNQTPNTGTNLNYCVKGVNTTESASFDDALGMNTDGSNALGLNRTIFDPQTQTSYTGINHRDSVKGANNMDTISFDDALGMNTDGDSVSSLNSINLEPQNQTVNIVTAEQTIMINRDKYVDVPLSRALEQLQTNEINLQEILYKLEGTRDASLQGSSQSVNIVKTLTDHTYCVTLNGKNTPLTVYPDEYSCRNTYVDTGEMHITSELSNLTLNNDDDRYEPIEVSMVLEEATELLNASPPCVLGVNYTLDIRTNTLSSSSSEFDGFHSDNLHEVTSHHNTTSMSTPSVNKSFHTSISTCSSSSSEFEGFHSDDLYDISSHPLNTPSGDTTYSLETDSDDTVIYTPATSVDIGNHMIGAANTQIFYLTEQLNAQYNPEVIKLWKTDARKKKWIIPVVNLSKSDIYALSKPAPNWDNINAYSSIEDIGSNSNKSKSSDIDDPSLNTLSKRHSVCKKHRSSESVSQGI